MTTPADIHPNITHFGWNEGFEVTWTQPEDPEPPEGMTLSYITVLDEMYLTVGEEERTIIEQGQQWSVATPTSFKFAADYDTVVPVTIYVPEMEFTYIEPGVAGSTSTTDTVPGTITSYYTQQSDTESYGSENYKTLTWYWQDIR